MNKSEYLDYIADYAINNHWEESHVKEQIRSLFMSWCIIFDVEADTQDCDNALKIIFYRARIDDFMGYGEFENYMLAFLV